MKLDYLKEFVVLANCLNYSTAARELFITQPSLSKHIARVEEELGVKLFVRDTHSVVLTESGKQCLVKATDIVSRYEELLKAMDASNRGMTGNIKIGFLNYTMGKYVSPVIDRIEELYPNMSISPYPSSANEIIDNLNSGRIDIGLFMRVPLDQDDRLQIHNVYREPLSVFTGKDSPLCKFPELSIEQLRDETFLEIDDDYQQHYEFAIRKLCMLHGFIPKGKVRVANLEAAVLAVQRGKGIYILPRSAKTWNLPSVSAIDIADKDCYLYGCAAYRKTNDNPALPLVIKEYDRLMNESLQEEQS